MKIRDACPDVSEKLGHWKQVSSTSNKQADGNSCWCLCSYGIINTFLSLVLSQLKQVMCASFGYETVLKNNDRYKFIHFYTD